MDQYRRIGTRLALQAGAPAVARSLALSRLQPDQADEAVFYFRIGLIHPDELQAIVEDCKSPIGQEVALGALHTGSATIPESLTLSESLNAACRARVARYRWRPFSDTHQNWMLENLLRRDSALCTAWIENWLEDAIQDDTQWLPREFEDVADSLAFTEKRRLVQALPPQLSSIRVGRLVRGLVNGDDELFRQFLRRNDLNHLRGNMFEGEPDSTWMRRAQLSLEAGHSPERIAQWTISAGYSLRGDASVEWERRIGLLGELRYLALDDALETVIDICVAAFERRKLVAIEEEKQERIFGRS